MKKETMETHKVVEIGLLSLLSMACVMVPDLAFAQTAIGNVMCTTIASEFNGTVANAIGTIAVCTVGLLACVGRVTWQQALIIATGLAVLFGVSTVVGWFGGTDCGTY